MQTLDRLVACTFPVGLVLQSITNVYSHYATAVQATVCNYSTGGKVVITVKNLLLFILFIYLFTTPDGSKQ